jgi:hypothetical protein
MAEFCHTECCCAECRCAECRYAQSRYTQCRCAQCRYAQNHGALHVPWTPLLQTRPVIGSGSANGSKIGLYHTLDGVTNHMYKLLHFLTTKYFLQ